VSSEEKFDVIIIGAGPAGSACAYTLAKEGKSVLLIERGSTPGSKNVSGARLYTYALKMLDADLLEEAAWERKVTHEEIMLLNGEQGIKIDYFNPAFNKKDEPPQSCTVLRATFDEWLAAKAEEIGALLACGIKVDELLEENGKIVGVKAGEDEVLADIVVAADGVNSLIAQKSGLMEDLDPKTVGVGVKEVIELPSSAIEERFGLTKDEGAALMILGCTQGIHGGGFLYTNKESISLGCVLTPAKVAGSQKKVHDILQELKLNPNIYPLIKEGQTVEYSAHLVKEAGYRGLPPKLYRDGFLVIGEAAGFVVNLGYTVRGIDLAIVSGIAAARGILAAKEAKEAGPAYLNELEHLKLLPTMRAVDKYFDLLDMSSLYQTYPKVAAEIFNALFRLEGEVAVSLKQQIKSILKENNLSLWQIIKDGLKGYRSI